MLWGYSGGDADAIAVSIGSEPQEILPDDRAWGFAFLSSQTCTSMSVTFGSIKA